MSQWNSVTHSCKPTPPPKYILRWAELYFFPISVPCELILGFNKILPSLYFFFPVKDLHWFPTEQNELDEDSPHRYPLAALQFSVRHNRQKLFWECRGIPVSVGLVIRTCTCHCCVQPWEVPRLLQLVGESHGTEENSSGGESDIIDSVYFQLAFFAVLQYFYLSLSPFDINHSAHSIFFVLHYPDPSWFCMVM